MKLRRAWNKLSRRLFWKIFLAFWLAMTLAGVGLLMVENTRTVRLAQRWRAVTGDALAVYAATAVQVFQNPQGQNVDEFLTGMEERTSIKAWLFDNRGVEVTGHALEERSKHPAWLQQRMAQLVVQARFSDGTQFADLPGITLSARPVRGTDAKIFVLVGLLPGTRYDFWGATPRVQALRFLSILLVTGSVSWLLAHHLTHPLEALRAATRRLAAGDLSARTMGLHSRRDELAGLATDFNEMAEHIDALLHNERRLTLAQRRLLADVAHELRSPIARATVALELAREALEQEVAKAQPLSEKSRARVVSSLDRIEQENGRLTDLIDRLLVVSRLESGVMEADFVPVELAGLVTPIVADANFEGASQGRSVQLTVSQDGVVDGIPTLLQSAVENPIRNALRHTAPQTEVRVNIFRQSTGTQEDWIEGTDPESCYTSAAVPSPVAGYWTHICIVDDGPGLPNEELSEVFRPFYRARGTRDRHKSGAGLGLTITARAIELHGGQFRVCNRESGGLMVEIRLPGSQLS